MKKITTTCTSIETLQEAITQDTTYTEAVSKILNTSVIVQFQKKYPYPPWRELLLTNLTQTPWKKTSLSNPRLPWKLPSF